MPEEITQLIRSAEDEIVLKDCKTFMSSRQLPEEPPPKPAEPLANTTHRPKRRRTAAPAEGLYQKVSSIDEMLTTPTPQYFLSTGLRDKWAPYIMDSESLMKRLDSRQADLLSDMDTDDVFMEEDDYGNQKEAPAPPAIFLKNHDSDEAAIAAVSLYHFHA